MDILLQVISDICRSESGFAVQLDESTDVTNCALYRFNCTDVTKGEFFFQATWFKMGKSKGVQNGWAPATLGRKSGFRAHVIEVAPYVIFLHCMIHRFALSCKVLSAKLFNVLSLVIKMVNNVKGSAPNSRLSKILCEDLSVDHSVLLFHSNNLCVGFPEEMLLNVNTSFVKNCWDCFNNPTNVKILSLS